MSYEQKDNTFTLFKNDKGENPKRPDYTGKALVNGVEVRLSAWIREGKSGKFMSGTIEPPREQAKPKPAPVAEPDDELPW